MAKHQVRYKQAACNNIIPHKHWRQILMPVLLSSTLAIRGGMQPGAD